MFLNHRPLLVVLLFLAASPVDVVARVLYSADANSTDTDGYPDDIHRLTPSSLDVNPLHLLCPVCSLLQFLVGGLLGGLLGSNLLKHLGIFACSLAISSVIHIPFLPNIICTAIFEIIFMLTKKAQTGLCPLLLLCPMPKKKDSSKNTPPQLSAEEQYEEKIVEIIENRDSANLSPQMEYFYQDLLNYLPLENLKGSGVEEPARQVLRNLVAAIEYHLAHRTEYLAARAA